MDLQGIFDRAAWAAGRSFAVMILMAVLMVPAVPAAWAQSRDIGPVLDRLERLERDIRTLNRQISRGESSGGRTSRGVAAPSPAAPTGPGEAAGVARLNVKLTALERDLRGVTGRAEELIHKIGQIEERLEKLVGDVDYRLTALERRAGSAPQAETVSEPGSVSAAALPAAPPAAPPAPPASMASSQAAPPLPPAPSQPGVLGTVTETQLQSVSGASAESVSGASPEVSSRGEAAPPPAPSAPRRPVAALSETAILPDAPPAQQYAFARKFLFTQRYDDAEQAFAAFLEAHPKDPLAGNAHYWLGETHYVRKDYVRAAEIFLKGYQSDSKGAKAPDTLLKLGMSLSNLGKTNEACATYAKLDEDFPKASTHILNLLVRERRRASCT